MYNISTRSPFTRFSVDLSLSPPQLSKLPADNGTLLDSRHHDLETVEIGQTSPLGTNSELLAPGAVGPLLLHLGILVGLLKHLLRGSTGELGDGDISEREALKVNLCADHVGGINESPVLVNHIHNDDQLPMLRAVVDEGHSPDLHKPAKHHGCGLGKGAESKAEAGRGEKRRD